MFDGVHLGHRMVLENAIREAHILNVPSVVFSFADHPQRLLSKTPTQLLSSLDERLEQFEALGFHYALILDFNEELQQLSPQTFVDKILVETLNAKHVTVGYDYRFGKDKAGNGEVLTALGFDNGFDVSIIEPVKRSENSQIASSTLIRKLLTFGDVSGANQLLGRVYRLSGEVTHGFQRGRQLGFPTANLQPPINRIVPAVGTYGGFAFLNDRTYPAVCNIGHSPTFDGGTPVPRIEVHLLQYTGEECYEETLTFAFHERIRDEMSFSSKEALIAQIEQDCLHVTHHAEQYAKNRHNVIST
jgi:riboflavin kinase/FMN adenylyltransferase